MSNVNEIESREGTDQVIRPAIGETCELRVRQERFNRNKQVESVLVDGLDSAHVHDQDAAFGLVVQQIFSDKNRLEKEVLTVNSKYILKSFSDVIKSYPTVAADFSEPLELESPFMMLYHFWNELDVYREKLDDDVSRMHLNMLFDFMGTAMGPERGKVIAQIKKGQIDFSRAWTIYRPGDLQIRFEHGHPWLLRCVKTAYEENTRQGKWIEIHCAHTDFDGTHAGEARLITKIYQKEHFASEHPAIIKNLPIFPRAMYERGEGLESELRKRGEHFLSLDRTCICQYDGRADHIKDPPYSWFDPYMNQFEIIWIAYHETGRVIIDRKTFQQDRNLTRVSMLASSADIENLLCPPFVYGFSLALKDWCRFYLDQIEEVKWATGCIEDLVMQEDQKTLLRALVSSHEFPENPRDQTKQKGKGLVILLHGAPGSGKTLTAETCAEVTKRGLFSTSLAELNKEDSAWWFERRLVQVLQYATIWKAIVLFDEADVFLEHRKDDAADASQRNALVAVFLKHLEYFSGIVFLTTNRVSVFDEAMKSRIHLALGYEQPNLKMRQTLWSKSIQSVIGHELPVEVEEAIDVFIRTPLNGREISNIINTASTLARFEKQQLQLKHIEQVLQTRKDFEAGLQKLLTDQNKRSTGPLTRQGSILDTVCEDPQDIGEYMIG